LVQTNYDSLTITLHAHVVITGRDQDDSFGDPHSVGSLGYAQLSDGL